MADTKTLTIDFTNPRTIKKSYNLKNYDAVRIVTQGNNNFLDGIDKVTASGSTLKVVADGKTITFKNIKSDILVEGYGMETPGVYYSKLFEDFYFESKFGNTTKTWLDKPSKTSVTGTSFSEVINLSTAYEPTAKNQKKKVGVKVNAGAGNDTITGTAYNDVLTGGADSDTFIFAKNSGKDTISDATKEDMIEITGVTDPTDLRFKRTGNNLEIFYDSNYDDNNKIIIKNHFKTAEDNRIDTLKVGENNLKLSEQTYSVEGKKKVIGTDSNDIISGSKVADKIFTGYGADTISGGKGNDVITVDGSGNKVINISSEDGNDTIVLNMKGVDVDGGFDLNLVMNDTYGRQLERTYKLSSNREDLIITNAYSEKVTDDGVKHKAINQTVTVKNYFANVDSVSLKINGVSVDDAVQTAIEASSKVDTSGKKIYGTPYADTITGSKNADIIYTCAGNDTITASAGNDKIYSTGGNNKYVYDKFVDELKPSDNHVVLTGQANLGHDTIIATGGNDTISLTNLGVMETANFFEPEIIHWTDKVYPSYTDNQYFAHLHFIKSGNDLVLSGYQNYKSKDVNTITLKDYFKYEKGEYGVKYIDNGLAPSDPNYEVINIADQAALCFDGNETSSTISWLKPNKFTGTFMNDIIHGNSKPDTLHGGDGNDIIYGGYSNGPKKDNLYGDAGNDTIFASDAYVYGGTGNDVIVSDFLDGSDIISDEGGYDRLSLRNRQYLTYFDVEQVNGQVTSTGDIYIKDITADVSPIPEIKEATTRYAGRPVFEVSDTYYEQLKTNPLLLENLDDYGDNKKYIDGNALKDYVPRTGYKLVCTDWDFNVSDYSYYYHGANTTALSSYENGKKSVYDTNSIYLDGNNVDTSKIVGSKDDGTLPYAKTVYDLTATEGVEYYGKRAILQNKDMGVVIKNGTTESTAIETIMLDRDAIDTTQLDGKIENMVIGDYNQTNINTIAANVATWLNNNKFTSVQDAIARGNNTQLDEMFELFENTYDWTTGVKFLRGSYADAESIYGGTIVGTAIVEDDDILGHGGNSTYRMTLKESDGTTRARMSMLSDYTGNDKLILDYNETGYSFLFDVEIDEKGNLLNYSRDFYVKFKGEEANNTGLQIMNGRETRHAIEAIDMVYDGTNSPYLKEAPYTENRLFTYNQATIDSVRESVAGWLAENSYMSVQDVLNSTRETATADVAALVAKFNEGFNPSA